MVSYAQQPHIGFVGAKLYFPDDTIQHAGVVVGMTGLAGHVYAHAKRDDTGDHHFLAIVRNTSAVSAACVMVRRDVFEEVGGFNAMLRVAYNDIDLCLKIIEAGYRGV